LTDIKVVKIRRFSVQGSLVRLDHGLPPPPPRRPRRQAVRQLLHSVFVPTEYPLVYACVTVHGQVTRVPFPHEHRRVTLPPLEWGPFGPVGKKLPAPLEDPPYLVCLYPLFPQAFIVKSPYALLQVTRDHERVDHFAMADPSPPVASSSQNLFFSF
jgi:hypothetical protein